MAYNSIIYSEKSMKAANVSPSMESNNANVRVLERGLAILRAFEPDNPWLSNSELSAITDIPKPTVSRITANLTASTHLIYSSEKAQYKLGTAVLTLGYLAASVSELTMRAKPLMQQLADEQKGSVVLASLNGLSMICHEVCHGHDTLFALRVHPGSRLNLSRSALGRALIGAMDTPERDELLSTMQQADPDHWDALEPEFHASIEQMQTYNYCVASGTLETGTNGIAVVIDSPEQAHAYSMGFAVPAHQVNAEHLTTIVAPQLLEIKHKLEHDLLHRNT